MKRKKEIALIALCMLLVILFCIFLGQPAQVSGVLRAYAEVIEDDIPDGLQLTIYYGEVNSLTRFPVTLQRFLETFGSDDRKIVVGADALRWNLPLLRKLDDSILKPIERDSDDLYEDVRLYYVFELNGEKILDVAINALYNSVIVNDVYVEYDPVFMEIIALFLRESAKPIEGPRDW